MAQYSTRRFLPRARLSIEGPSGLIQLGSLSWMEESRRHGGVVQQLRLLTADGAEVVETGSGVMPALSGAGLDSTAP